MFFEAFVGDLWCAAVDAAGSVISARIQANQKWESSRDEMRASKVSSAQAHPRQQPGSFKREIGQVSFQKLSSIKDYYKIAFENNIEDIFDTSAEGYIYALADIRNCIAHRAGLVDARFCGRAKKFSELAHLNINDHITLDGALVKKLRNAAAITGLRLLQSVDEMLIRGD